jgi:PleD family two-component response regulator
MPSHTRAILLIDSRVDSRAHHAESLQRDGFTVVSVANCDDAFVALTTLAPQLIIVSFDARTRDDCLAFCQQLKADAPTRAVPILLTSDTINGDDLRRATNSQALVLSLCSPLEDTKLTSAVRGVLAVGEDSRGGRSQSPQDGDITQSA